MISINILVFLNLCNALKLTFYNNIANTPQEAIEFETGSLFYTGVLPHIESFTCTADNILTETVTWYDTSGNEVLEGTGASTSLYWTGSNGNKTLHTSNNAGTDFITVANQGNNFTCRVNGTAQVKYFGIYWVRPILGGLNTIRQDLRGFRIYTKDVPPVISEFTLQRGLFNFDFNKRYKVQSMMGSTTILFRPDVITSTVSSIPSIIDNVTFSNTSNCQSIGTSDSDILYTTISDKPFLNYETGSIGNPQFSNSLCVENGTASTYTLTIENISPDLRYTCPLVFNGVFIDTEGLDLDMNTALTTPSVSLNLNVNRRRLWIDFQFSNSISLLYDREYVCEDMYGTRLSFRQIVNGNIALEVFTSITASAGITASMDLVQNTIASTLYCLSMSSTVDVTWYIDTSANRTQSNSPVQVTSNPSILPYVNTPRTGRSDLFLNSTVTSDTEGYYTCRDGINPEIRIGVFLQTPVAPMVTTMPAMTYFNFTISVSPPINITCSITNIPYPPALNFWTGPNPSSTNILDTTGFNEGDSGFYRCHGSNVVGIQTIPIYIAIVPPPPTLVAFNLTIAEFYFEEDPFQLSCTFSVIPNLQSSLMISWYKDNVRLTNGVNGVQIQEMSTGTPNTLRSVLTVASAVPANTGQYTCRATVGASDPTVSGTADVVVEAAYQPDVIALELVRIGSISTQLSWVGTNRTRPTPETFVVSYCELPQCNSYINSPTVTSTSYTLIGLRGSSNYSVFVIATNRYGSTDGERRNFTTLPDRTLYFMESGVNVYFASGSIFRGVNPGVGFPTFLFSCSPDSINDNIVWYFPNGDLILEGSGGGQYSIDVTTGISTLNLANVVTAENQGRNFTCRVNSSGFIHDHYFGVYYILPNLVTGTTYVGDRIYTTSDPPIIREFVLQRGTFDIDTNELYEVQSVATVLPNFGWMFNPPLVQPQTYDNVRTLRNVKFNSSAVCQLGTSFFEAYFFSVSDKPFILKTTPMNSSGGIPFSAGSCIENNSTAFEYTIGEGVDIGVTCPLFYNARFLDTSDFIQLDYRLNRNNPRRLWVDPSKTLAMVKHDREYICEDMYGTRASFKARVDASASIQVFGNDSTIAPTNNNTMYLVNQVTLYCLSDSVNSGVVWYSATNTNSTLPPTYAQVSADSAKAQPYVSNPRNGRSDLVVRSSPSPYLQGYYYCQDSTGQVMFYSIFTQQPVVPVAQINPITTTLQIVIGTSSNSITCGSSNSSYPTPISYWTGTSTSIIYANQLLEANSGIYTCISSNVVGYTSATITITVIPPPPQSSPPQLVSPRELFVTDVFQLSCQFATFSNVTPSFYIQWYHNGTLNTLSPNTTSTSGNTATSTLTVSASSLLQAGDYHCVATVGASGSTTSTPISVIINPITLPNAISVSLINTELRNATVSWTPSIQYPTLTEIYTLVYQRIGGSSYQSIIVTSTSFTITGLLFNSQYRIYINATNRLGTTQGPATTFSTERVRLYFVRDGAIIQFAPGSIFRGGTHNVIIGGVFEFYCVPDSPDQLITWYGPNGAVIPSGFQTLSLYHVRNNNTGESVLYTNERIAAITEGNYTCSFNPPSGPANMSTFGIYYVWLVLTIHDIYGVRLYGPGNFIYEFVYQIGTFDVDFSLKYDIECLDPSNQVNQWQFDPNLLSEDTRTNTRITQALFNSNATCQYISCSPSIQYPVFSNKPFFLQTNATIGQPNCRPNNYIYNFTLGSSIGLSITCPLIFGARFLDIGSGISLLQNDFTVDTTRRLFFNSTNNIATLAYERDFICEDVYGERVTFSIRVLANEAIQLLGSEDSNTPIVNGTDFVGANIPNTISCVTQSSDNSANWYVDSNPNRALNIAPMAVNTNTAMFPYVSYPRGGRSNLNLNGTISAGNEGFYTCVTNPSITVGIFSQTPVVPTATISPDQTVIQVVIGTNTPVLNCEHSNTPHPPPINFWTGSMSSSTSSLDTNLLSESDSGMYTCTASNVEGMSTDTIAITVIPPPPQSSPPQLVSPRELFVTDVFQLSCQFATFSNVTPSFYIQWYHNGTLNTLSPNTTNTSGNTATSTLTVSASSLLQAGDYHCVATVGASGSTTSTPISVIINPITLPNAVSINLTNTELRNATVSWTPSIQYPTLTETYTLVYQRIGGSSYQSIIVTSTSFTITGLLFNSQYRVYINATNRFGTTQGPATTFSTERVRLYFVRDGEIIQFAPGSIFRGGTHNIIIGGVFEFYCVPDSPDQVITWYGPNGAVIPSGFQALSLYHVRYDNTGESVLYTNERIAAITEGNYTCSFNPPSGPANVSTFGIYYVWLVLTIHDIYGVRLYGPGNLIYEFVYQIGTFDVDFSLKYDIECLDPSNQVNQWQFDPNLLSEDIRTNTRITQAMLNPNATCQYISCSPSIQYPVFSNKPFFLQTNATIGQPNCRPNNYIYNFTLGSSIGLSITCPLIFGARFLDIGSGISLIENDFTVDTTRRLFFNSTNNIATLAYERDFICEDVYGERVTFSIRVLANEAIQLLGSDGSNTPIANGTDFVGTNIPNTISCVTQSSGNSANWYVDSNPNRALNIALMAVNTNTAMFPYVSNPRGGRSNLNLNGTISAGNEGFYTCVTNPSITAGIFSQTPVVPTATISPDQTVIQVVIGTNTPVLNCGHSNTPHPLPINFWTGSMNSSTATLDTNFLLESDSGMYTCTASNVEGMSTDTITITVIPPPPQFINIRETLSPIYISDEIRLACQFSTFSNVTSQIEINWYKDGVTIPSTNVMTVNTGIMATSSLNIPNGQINNEGNYHCQATVGTSQASVSTNLTFNFNPPPTPIAGQSNSTLQDPFVTQDTIIKCEFTTLARFQSDLIINWFHNTTILLRNGGGIQTSTLNKGSFAVESTLSISDISFSQAGEYHCVGRIIGVLNSEQSDSNPFTIKVRRVFPIFDSIGLTSQFAYEEASLRIFCIFTILPRFTTKLTFTWYHNSTEISSCQSKYQISTSYDESAGIANTTLEIQSPESCQSGEYYCVASISELRTTSTPYQLTFQTASYQQKIEQLQAVSNENGGIRMEWMLSHSPQAGERFRIKLTSQSADSEITVNEYIAICDTICKAQLKVNFVLENIAEGSLCLTEVFVMNSFGESSQILLFDPQSLISSRIASQNSTNSIIIITPLIIIILLLASGYVIIFIIWIIRHCNLKWNKKPKYQENLPQTGMVVVKKNTMEMVNIDTPASYYNIGKDLSGEPHYYAQRTLAEIETDNTYARVDEDGKIIDYDNLIGDVKKDREYEVLPGDY